MLDIQTETNKETWILLRVFIPKNVKIKLPWKMRPEYLGLDFG